MSSPSFRSFFSTGRVVGLIAALALSFISPVRGDSAPAMPFSDVDGENGLRVDVYHLSTATGSGPDVTFSELNAARKYALAQKPDYSFSLDPTPTSSDVVASLALKAGDDGKTSGFFGPSPPDATASDGLSLQSGETIIRFFGFFHVQHRGTYRFELPAADGGAMVFISGNGQPGTGNLVLAKNGSNSIPSAPGFPNGLGLDFFAPDNVTQTGWFPIEILYLSRAGAAGTPQLQFNIRGEPTLEFKNGTPSGSHVAAFVPLHRYTFADSSNGRVNDDGVADQVGGKLVGAASIGHDALVTTGDPADAALLDADAITRFFHGSFTIEEWFSTSDATVNKQTLFSFAGDTHRYVLGRLFAGMATMTAQVELNNGTDPPLVLKAPVNPDAGETFLSLSFDATTHEADLYLNDKKVDSGSLPAGLRMGDFVSPDLIGIAGLSPFKDPSLHGETAEFRFFRVPLSEEQIEQNFQIGPNHQVPID